MEFSERLRMRVFLAVTMAFLVSTYYCWKEFKYAIFGKQAQAQVISENAYGKQTDEGPKVSYIRVEYSFTDDKGNTQNAFDEVPPRVSLPPIGVPGQTVKVQYMGTTSRVAGHNNIVAPIIFFVTLAFVGWQGWKIWKEANQ